MTLQVRFSVRADEPREEPDLRQRTLVMLARADRPTHYKYSCHRCQYPVAEIVNRRVRATSDVMDTTTKDFGAIGVRCDGRYFDEYEGKMVNCRHWYYFMVND